MTEAKDHMPQFRNNLSLTKRQYEISKTVIAFVPKKFFQINFDRLKTVGPLKEVQQIRLDVEQKLAEQKLLSPDELIGLQLATSIALQIDLIYYHKLKGNTDELKTESDRLIQQIDSLPLEGSLEEKLKIDQFLRKHPLWRKVLNLIKDYALNQTRKIDDSNDINKAATRLAKRMGATKGPKLFFLPEEENEKVMGDRVERKTFVPQILFTIPVEGGTEKNVKGKKIFHPLGLDHGNLFYGFVVLQAGSALKWEQSALAIDGGALLLINNFVGNYEESVKSTFRAARRHKIKITKSEIWQTFIDLLLYHEIGHSKVYPKIDKRMGSWTEWMANSHMYSKVLDFAKDEENKMFREKIIFMLMSQVELTKRRVKDQSAEKYTNSELLFLHLLEKSGLINFEDASIHPERRYINKLIKSIIICRNNYDLLNQELEEINRLRRKKIINFWQKYFES